MNSLQIDTNLTYCPETLTVNQPLSIVNKSDEQLAFKIKTNQKSLLSMYINHGFIKPFSTMSIPVKIVEEVEESIVIKLQVNWAKVTPQMKQKNDTKMATTAKENIFKKVFTVLRKAQKQSQSNKTSTLTKSNAGQQKPSTLTKSNAGQQKPQTLTKFNLSDQKTSTFTISNVSDQMSSVYDSVYSSSRNDRDDNKITPFEYERQIIQQPLRKYEENKVIKPQQISRQQQKKGDTQPVSYQKLSNLKQPAYQEGPVKQQKHLASSTPSNITLVQQLHNLQVVSQQDQEDHERQLQQIRTQQVEQKRRIDEIKYKLRKANQQIKNTQIIDPKVLFLVLGASFSLGGFIQYLLGL